MERVFVTWWILILAAALFVGLAIVYAADEQWLGVAVMAPLAVVSVWLGLVHRSRLSRLEESDHPFARKS
jgi:membrane protein implicated in regulation of membrane protease activity